MTEEQYEMMRAPIDMDFVDLYQNAGGMAQLESYTSTKSGRYRVLLNKVIKVNKKRKALFDRGFSIIREWRDRVPEGFPIGIRKEIIKNANEECINRLSAGQGRKDANNLINGINLMQRTLGWMDEHKLYRKYRIFVLRTKIYQKKLDPIIHYLRTDRDFSDEEKKELSSLAVKN